MSDPALLIAHPWDAGDRRRAAPTGAPSSVSAQCGPRVIAPLDRAVRFDVQSRGHLPAVSFPFLLNGERVVARRLPLDAHEGADRHSIEGRLSIGEFEVGLTLSDAPGRPGRAGGDPDGYRLDAHCEWQIHGFEELCDAASGSWQDVVRCGWRDAKKVWIDPGRSEARMALIAKLAQEADLARTLRSIGRAPRRVLERVRVDTAVARIQELDAHCIRDYVRRPGVTVAEKAGPRQRLLGVRRRETERTLENRVTSWTLERITQRAVAYSRQNAQFLAARSARVLGVRRFGRLAHALARSEGLEQASPRGLQHPVQPNYTLQMDARYRIVYRAYRRLIREKWVLDDAWSWQQALWADSVRQLTFSYLDDLLVAPYPSQLYCRREPDRGTWSLAPLAPGPYETQSGELHVLDATDVFADVHAWFQSGLPFAEALGATGCDFALWWPERCCLVVVWAVVRTSDASVWDSELHDAAAALARLTDTLRSSSGSKFDVRGLLLAACTTVRPGASDGPASDTGVVGVRFGVGAELGVPLADFESALELVADPHLHR